ncbi:hypothetical protein Zm00014a_026835 [Zea mays]|uniref:KIB1-4 beta-propeller domain-containing protein n=1 Tax=Zea mays TaxID=4577 RepID=A0A3L6F5H2_MAIZE|nr:hypothetical protein Zm00014a_026835 [Zea mays]
MAHELHDNLMDLILVRVPCKVDRASISLVCRAWRDKVARLGGQAPPPLPWLLLPSRFRNDPTFRAACVLSGCSVHPQHNLLTTMPPGARFVGSYDGAWNFLYFGETRRHRLFNARTRQVRKLPLGIYVNRDGHQTICIMVILAATLSSSPDDSMCVGAAIIARDQGPHEVLQPYNRWIALWRMGWEMAVELDMVDMGMYLAEDVVYHCRARAFYFLLIHGVSYEILVCTPNASPEYPRKLHISFETHHFLPLALEERISPLHSVIARYLVVSRGELLMVVRIKAVADQQTCEFKVFRAKRRPQMPDYHHYPVAQYPWEWIDLDTLDGRILFVGYGCSRSYQADAYPGFKPGIYFLDDGMFYEVPYFGGANTRPYPCTDNGMWSEGRSQRCFPTPNSSDYSPPVWLLP